MADDTMAWGVERKSLLLQLQTQKQSDDKQTSPIFVEIEGDKTAEVQLLKKRIQEYEVSMMKAEREFKLCQAQAADDRVAFGKRETAWNAEKARLMTELDASRRRERKSSEASDRAADEALAELRESLRATEAVRDDYKDEVDQLRLDLIAKGDGHDSLLERVLQLEKHLHEEKEKHTATTTELSGKKAELVDLTRSLKTMASELEDRTVEAKAAQERCKAAEDGRSRAEEQLAAAKRAQETCERTIKTLEDTIERLRRQLVESNDDVEDLRRQLQVKTEADERYLWGEEEEEEAEEGEGGGDKPAQGRGSVVAADFYNAGALLSLPDDELVRVLAEELLPAASPANTAEYSSTPGKNVDSTANQGTGDAKPVSDVLKKARLLSAKKKEKVPTTYRSGNSTDMVGRSPSPIPPPPPPLNHVQRQPAPDEEGGLFCGFFKWS